MSFELKNHLRGFLRGVESIPVWVWVAVLVVIILFVWVLWDSRRTPRRYR